MYLRQLMNISAVVGLSACAASGNDGTTHARGQFDSSSNQFDSNANAGGSGALITTGDNGGGLLGGSSGAVGGSGAMMDPNVCASASVRASRITPTVELVIDGSGSMSSTFGNGTRW
ncbi:MAG TPA: hypothetical protein VHZ95_13970, partial [Polyangiales bacterium]|nr:hypothetical protein [Polyangiales bacterium]